MSWTGRLRSALVRLVVAILAASALGVAPWRWLDPPTTAFIWRYERVSSRRAEQRWISLAEISPHLAVAVIASEDQKFADHRGFDFDSIADAWRDGDRGGSTLTQQVAKNLYLWPGRSWSRKGLEAWLTLWIEALWPKARILEVYLNVAEFGPGTYGAASASERFFGTSARRMTAEQAARLAAVLPSPRRMSAASPSPYVLERAAEIRDRMRRLERSGRLRALLRGS